jgi:hypothetical protein
MSATQPDTPTPQSDDSPDETQAEPTTDARQVREETVDELPLDQTFELLKNRRRRAVLQYLRETDEEVVSIGELAEHIAAVENDIDVDAVSSSQRKRAYVGLYQCHLPKMDDMNVIEFRKNRGEISRASNATRLEEFLDHDHNVTRPWYPYYLAIALGGVFLLAVGQFAGTGTLSATVSLAVLVAALLVCASAHAYEEASLPFGE